MFRDYPRCVKYTLSLKAMQAYKGFSETSRLKKCLDPVIADATSQICCAILRGPKA